MDSLGRILLWQMLVWLLPMHHTNSYAVHTQVHIAQKYIERMNHKLVLAKGTGAVLLLNYSRILRYLRSWIFIPAT